MKTLVTGGASSGKSAHAESLLAAEGKVSYIAPGPTTSEDADPDWAARIAAHRDRRPATWRTVESRHLATVLAEVDGAIIVDCLGTWLTALLDEHQLWQAPAADAADLVRRRCADATDALAARSSPDPVVLVTNEVGLGVIPEHRSGRLFRDLLGTVNQSFAPVVDEVHLVVSGRVLVL